MSTVAELERLVGLISRLTPLSSAQRGELIRAQSWNSLVEAVIEVAEIVVANEQSDGFQSHTHLNQVNLSWLDANLRSLIERGPISEPTTAARLAKLERLQEAASQRDDDRTSDISEIRNRVTDVSAKDLIREATMTALERKFDGSRDGRDDVLALRRTMDSIRKDIATVLEISSRFTVNGEIVDMTGIVDKLERLAELRQRLTKPDGELLDATTLELRLTKLTNILVTEEELTTALDSRLDDFTPGMLEGIEENLQTNLTAFILTEIEKQEKNLQDLITAEFAKIDGLVSQAVANKFPAFRESLLAEIRTEFQAADNRNKIEIEDNSATAREQLRTELLKEMDTRFAEFDRTMIQRIDALINKIRPGLVDEIVKIILAKLNKTDDFTLINGIGPTIAQRLVDANVKTFLQLSKMTIQQVADILNTSPENVKRLRIIPQAQELAAQQ